MTDRARYVFNVKNFDPLTSGLWIALEPFDGTLPNLEHGFMGLDLKPGTTVEQAHQIAEFLNKNFPSISYTGPKLKPVEGQ